MKLCLGHVSLKSSQPKCLLRQSFHASRNRKKANEHITLENAKINKAFQEKYKINRNSFVMRNKLAKKGAKIDLP